MYEENPKAAGVGSLSFTGSAGAGASAPNPAGEKAAANPSTGVERGAGAASIVDATTSAISGSGDAAPKPVVWKPEAKSFVRGAVVKSGLA